MGTRAILAITIKGKARGLFSKFDGYPIGLGLAVLNFLASLDADGWAQLVKNLEEVEWYIETGPKYVTRSMLTFNANRFSSGGGTRVRPEGVDLNELYGDYGFCDMKFPDGTYEIFTSIPPYKVLPLIQQGIVKHLPDAFMRNPFYMHDPQIEFGYIVDLETKTFETRARMPGKESPVVLDVVKTGVGDAEEYISCLMAKFEKVLQMSNPADGVWDYRSLPLPPATRRHQPSITESQMLEMMCGLVNKK